MISRFRSQMRQQKTFMLFLCTLLCKNQVFLMTQRQLGNYNQTTSCHQQSTSFGSLPTAFAWWATSESSICRVDAFVKSTGSGQTEKPTAVFKGVLQFLFWTWQGYEYKQARSKNFINSNSSSRLATALLLRKRRDRSLPRNRSGHSLFLSRSQ